MISLTLNETMSGWTELNSDRKHEAFEFEISVFFADRLRPLAPQPFEGVARFADRDLEVPVTGELTLKPRGPRYELSFDYPSVGPVTVSGEKSYSLFELRESLTTCPLTIYQQGQAIGYAEVAYRGPLLTFPLRAIRLTSRSLDRVQA